ncbi:MAG: TetR/AcrR family transcriptional regulator [Bacteroidia bacterium]|nr:TetR/AcrR family transcriptional regulator [Bacteroidia bacterium]MDW8015751.1 TetR/AcrR family transcriptional regulator [Bacteroidia bacterium]
MQQRERILEEALRLFAERGYERVSLRQLASKVGLRSPTLYHYFPTKEALLETLAARIADRFEKAVEGIAESDWEVTYKLERFCLAHLTTLLENPLQAAIFLREAPQFLSEPERQAFLSRQRLYEAKLESILQEGIQKNLFREIEPRFMAVSLLAALNATATWYQPEGHLTPAQIAYSLSDIFLRGLIRTW